MILSPYRNIEDFFSRLVSNHVILNLEVTVTLGAVTVTAQITTLFGYHMLLSNVKDC